MDILTKLNYGYDQIDAMPIGPEKAALHAVNGLMIDGGHHKQWSLARVLEALGVDLSQLRDSLTAMGYDFDDGIAP
jgi:hypothetical protein